MKELCPECKGTGFEITTDEAGVSRASRCACSVGDCGAVLLKSARIPRRYEHCTFESFKPADSSSEKAMATARRWVESWTPDFEEGQGLLFHGKPGTGKTHLAVAIVIELITTKTAKAVFYEQRELLKALQGTFNTHSGISESQLMSPVQTSEILVLDDLGAGRTTEWARDVLHEIIAYRYNNKLHTILTTNCSLPGEVTENERDGILGDLDLKQRLGDALMSRLHEMCRFVPLRGVDFRQIARSAQYR